MDETHCYVDLDGVLRAADANNRIRMMDNEQNFKSNFEPLKLTYSKVSETW